MTSNLAVGRGLFAIAPNDVNLLPNSARALYIGVGGDIKVKCANGSIVTVPNVPQGVLFPVECVMVYATGTTASQLFGVV